MSSNQRPSPLLRLIGRFAPAKGRAAFVLSLLLIQGGLYALEPRLLGAVVEQLAPAWGSGSAPSAFLPLLCFLAAAMLLRSAFAYAAAVNATALGQDLESRLRDDLYTHVIALPFAYHDRHRSGETITRCLRDMEQARHFFREVWFGWLEVALLVLLIAVGIVLTHWTFAAVVLPIYAAGLALTLRSGKTITALDRVVCDDYDEVNSALTENITGAQVVRAFGREPEEVLRFGGRMDSVRGGWRKLERYWTGILPLVNHLTTLSVPAVLAVGALRIGAGAGGLGETVAVLFYCRQIHHRLRPLTRLIIVGQKAVASAQRVFEVLDHSEAIEVRPPRRVLAGAGPLRVSLENASFAHRNGVPVIQDLSLEIRAGEALGIIGPTGAGKSSLVHLLARFYEPSAGTIRLDGIDLRHLAPSEVRRAVALVFQEPFLFSASVAENVAYGLAAPEPERLRRSLEDAAAADFVDPLPDREQTMIGERGVSLSGGQRQRLTIARALMRQPRLLILDDATASLDAITERRLFAALRRPGRASTLIVISQRVPSVRWCDRIAVLEAGRIVGLGTHEDLLAHCPLYREIEAHQRLEEVPS